jgi:hypothetical protein
VQIASSVLPSINRTGTLNVDEVLGQLKTYNVSKETMSLLEEQSRGPHDASTSISDDREVPKTTSLTAGEVPSARAETASAAAQDEAATRSTDLPIILEINMIPHFLKVVAKFHGTIDSFLAKEKEWSEDKKARFRSTCYLARDLIQQVWELD